MQGGDFVGIYSRRFSRGDWKLVFEFFNLGVCIGEFNLSAFPYRDADKA